MNKFWILKILKFKNIKNLDQNLYKNSLIKKRFKWRKISESNRKNMNLLRK